MNSLQILALSSSKVGNGTYLEMASGIIENFLSASVKKIAFIPFASVDSYYLYETKVKEGLPSFAAAIQTVTAVNAGQLIEEADAIMVGGGNTFKLLHDLYKANLVEIIVNRVSKGTPYLGWSAGANLIGSTICTTNDMPIIEPQSFKAFGFFPFQINPHYYNIKTEGFNGETRDQRLEEFLKLNTDKKIFCLPEGTCLQLKNGQLLFDGIQQGILMSSENGKTVHQIIKEGSKLNHLL